MGRRSVNTTKSGKFMNPTDQARKEARKRELKKNKKQRKMVRDHVLKGKDPNQILEELEKLEEMEVQSGPIPLPNDKAIKEKKRKLRETLDRLLFVYEKEDPARAIEIKRVLAESEKRKLQLQDSVYDGTPQPNEEGNYGMSDILTPGSIPLPHLGMMVPGNIPLPGTMPYPVMPHAIIPPGPPSSLPPGLIPPGPPPGPPPREAFRYNATGYRKTRETVPVLDNINDDGDSESEGMETDEEDLAPPGEEQLVVSEARSLGDRHVRFEQALDDQKDKSDSEDEGGSGTLQDRLLKLAGQAKGKALSDQEGEDQEEIQQGPIAPARPPGMVPPGPPPGLPRQPRPVNLMQPQRPLMRMMPPGPPPGRPPAMPSGLPPRGMPPRPSLGLPPNMPPPLRGQRPMMPPGPPPLGMMPPRNRPMLPPPGAVLSAPPSVHKPAVPSASKGGGKQGSAVITAKPQLRNTQAELTRLVPVALRVKREQPKTNKQKVRSAIAEEGFRPSPSPAQTVIRSATKDDAYAQFMKEMEVLL